MRTLRETSAFSDKQRRQKAERAAAQKRAMAQLRERHLDEFLELYHDTLVHIREQRRIRRMERAHANRMAAR